MRAVVSLAALLASLILASASSLASARDPRVFIRGIEYLRVADWAEDHSFRLSWTVPRREARLSSSWSTMNLTVDSRRAVINGVTVWLSYAVAFQQGALWISATDIATSLNPVLFPTRNSGGKKIFTVCLDPGHGGKDPGNRDGRQQEKVYTLLLAKELSAQLAKAGLRINMTRSGDTFLDLDARPEMARRRDADLFISLHFNSAGKGGSGVEGAEVYCLTPAKASSTNAGGDGAGSGPYPGNRQDSKNMLLAYHLQKSMLTRVKCEDRGVKRARFAVLRSAQMPAVLVEGGFMTSPAESKKIYAANYRRQLAQAITEGILAYKKSVEQ